MAACSMWSAWLVASALPQGIKCHKHALAAEAATYAGPSHCTLQLADSWLSELDSELCFELFRGSLRELQPTGAWMLPALCLQVGVCASDVKRTFGLRSGSSSGMNRPRSAFRSVLNIWMSQIPGASSYSGVTVTESQQRGHSDGPPEFHTPWFWQVNTT